MMNELSIELGTPSKHKNKKKKSYDLLRRDSNGVETASSVVSKCSRVKLRMTRKADEYKHIWGPFLRVMGIVVSILILVLWISKAKGGYQSMDSYFKALTNDIHPSPGSQSLLALTLEESGMGLEYLERYRERNLGVIIVSAKNPENDFMNRAFPEETPVGKFIQDVLNMHLTCDSRNLTEVMKCKTCALTMHNHFWDHMNRCAKPQISAHDLESAYNDYYVEGGPYEESYKSRHIWFDLFESAESYFNTKEKYGEEEARRRFVSKDGTVTLIGLQPRLGYFHKFPHYMESFLNPLIASYFSDEDSEYRVEVSSWPLLSKGAADGFEKDLASGDFYILPLSFFILAYTVGSIAVVVFATLPISFLYVIDWLDFAHTKWEYIFPGFSVSLWIVLVVALSIDYSLFILSRYSEELKKSWVKRYQGHRRRLRSIQVSGEENDEYDENTDHLRELKEADWFDYALHKHVDETLVTCLFRALDELYADGYEAVWVSMTTAGNTVTISGLTLAASFIGMVMVDMQAVKALGMTCVVSTLVTVAVTVTMIPALLVLTFLFQPLLRRAEIKSKRCFIALFRKCKALFVENSAAFVHPGTNGGKGRTFSMVPILLNKSMEESELDNLESLSSSKEQEQNDDEQFDFPDDVSNASSLSGTGDSQENNKKMSFWRRVGQFCRDRPVAVVVGVLLFALPIIACVGRLRLTISFNNLLPVDDPAGIGKQRILDVGLPSSTAKVNMVITAPVGYAYVPTLFEDNYFYSDQLGGYGGSCTCPNGQVYQVGDNMDTCGSLSCVGGHAGTCNNWDGEWSHHGVVCATQEKPQYTMIRPGAECSSSDSSLGIFGSADECAFACGNTEGCKYFIYGTHFKAGQCFVEYTDSPTCPEGFELDNYNFYELQKNGCHEDDAFVIEIGHQLGLELSGCADASAFCHKSLVNSACECTCEGVDVELPTIDGQCVNDNDLVRTYTEAMGHMIESCDDAKSFCSIIEVASACECTLYFFEPSVVLYHQSSSVVFKCSSASTITQFSKHLNTGTCKDEIEEGFPCGDNDEAVAEIARQLGYEDIDSCSIASQFCSVTGIRTVCADSCGVCDGSGQPKCVDNDALLKRSADQLGFAVSTCCESSYFCAIDGVATICPVTCKRCQNHARNTTKAKYGSILNERHFSDVVKAVEALLEIEGYGFVAHDFTGVAWFNGRAVKLNWALNALQANDTMRTVEQSQYRDMFREHVNGMMPDALHVDTLGEGMSLSVVTIRLPFDGYGSHFEDWLYKARDKAKVIESEVDGTSARFASGLAIQVDDKANLLRKAPGIMIATVCGMVFLFSVVAFRSLVLGPRLLLTVALTLGIVFGATAIVFTEIFWLTLVVVSPVSVGFVLDYDIFLLGRVFEFRTEGYSTSDALILGLEHTGSIITTAGIIMVSAFLALLMSSNPVVVQLGFQLSIAVLVDTFLVRTFFVPALMQIGVEWNWWPKRMPEVTKRMK